VASEIEVALYGEERAAHVTTTGEVGERCVLRLILSEAALCLRIASWERRYAEWTDANFEKPELLSFAQSASESCELSMPWGIEGFHSRHQEDGRWVFSLNATFVRWCWISAWPKIARCRAEQGAAADRGNGD
jgi:hypothetical protein